MSALTKVVTLSCSANKDREEVVFPAPLGPASIMTLGRLVVMIPNVLLALGMMELTRSLSSTFLGT